MSSEPQHSQALPDEPESMNVAGTGGKTSAYEKADKAVDGLSAAASAAGRGLIILYALAIIVLGVWFLFGYPGWERIIGIPVAGYGVYLLLGGSMVIY